MLSVEYTKCFYPGALRINAPSIIFVYITWWYMARRRNFYLLFYFHLLLCAFFFFWWDENGKWSIKKIPQYVHVLNVFVYTRSTDIACSVCGTMSHIYGTHNVPRNVSKNSVSFRLVIPSDLISTKSEFNNSNVAIHSKIIPHLFRPFCYLRCCCFFLFSSSRFIHKLCIAHITAIHS